MVYICMNYYIDTLYVVLAGINQKQRLQITSGQVFVHFVDDIMRHHVLIPTDNHPSRYSHTSFEIFFSKLDISR